jgi:hypothetical protein
MVQQYITGKLMMVIKSLYSNVKSCVAVNGCQSDYFTNNCGLMQGEVLSPILFSLYINDFETQFISSNCASYECLSLNLFLLMYADDIVLFSESVQELQEQLNTLQSFSE